MEFLKCIVCGEEVDIIDDGSPDIDRKMKCYHCGFTNCLSVKKTFEKKYPEIYIVKKRS